jgi:pyruvate dehydrogenase E1 component beta subunit
LLAAAIRDDDPVVYLEHRGLYWSKGSIMSHVDPATIGLAAVVRPGADVTVVAVSRMVQVAMSAAEKLAADGVDVEVVDLRTVSPIDLETITESIRRTGRLVVAHEAVVTGGLGAELVAGVHAAAFNSLTSPAIRVGAPFTPVPASPHLEHLYVPSVDDVIAAVLETLPER